MLHDLNKFAIRPILNFINSFFKKTGADLARYLAANCIAFKGLVEMEKV